MASDLNKWCGTGRLTKDPELRHTQGGTAICSFSIAVNYTYVSNGEKKTQPSFFNCVAWAKLGETINTYMHKGSRIGIEGRLQQRSWEDKDTGAKRYATEIVVDSIVFLDNKKTESTEGESASQPQTAPPVDTTANPFSDSDIPF